MEIITELEIYKNHLDNIANGLYERNVSADFKLMSHAANVGQHINNLMEEIINFEASFQKVK